MMFHSPIASLPSRHAYRSLMVGVLAAALLAAGTGCDGPSRLEPPQLDPQQVGRRALELYDADGDGRLSRSECQSSPPLLAAFDRYDSAPPDGAISAQEIASRIQAMLDTRVGQMPCHCTITLNGQPLADAHVRLVPDDMFGGSIAEARGISSYKGLVRPERIDAAAGTPGVHYGLYRVEITHPNHDLPPQYNSATTLGMEVSPLERDSDSATFALVTSGRAGR